MESSDNPIVLELCESIEAELPMDSEVKIQPEGEKANDPNTAENANVSHVDSDAGEDEDEAIQRTFLFDMSEFDYTAPPVSLTETLSTSQSLDAIPDLLNASRSEGVSEPATAVGGGDATWARDRLSDALKDVEWKQPATARLSVVHGKQQEHTILPLFLCVSLSTPRQQVQITPSQVYSKDGKISPIVICSLTTHWALPSG